MSRGRIYIAGPMRGKPYYNFMEFDSARVRLLLCGWEVVSPADIDRDHGFNALTSTHPRAATGDIPEGEFPLNQTLACCAKRDVEALSECNAIYMLKGWEESKGAKAEKAVAEWLGLDVLYETEPDATVPFDVSTKPTNPKDAIGCDNGTVRRFDTGATRDTADDKLDFDGFFSPLVMESFAQYMHGHRKQSDGSLRDSDNWRKGIPRSVYMKSMWRHFFDVWCLHHGLPRFDKTGRPISLEEALNALRFNVNGYQHEHLRSERNPKHYTVEDNK